MRSLHRAAAGVALALAAWGLVPAQAGAEPTKPADPPAPKTTIDADGRYQVGTDIVPGIYKSGGPPEGKVCYFKRMAGDKLVENALTKQPQVIQIEATDTVFVTNDCQPWQLTQCPPDCVAKRAPHDLLGQLGDFIGRGVLSGR
ncbi:hypothetical protein [uncultured Mycolicibacterium sp.]|uniref:hypothetical protein n=1 Tax=uncultured Mycolicibacterium sp. TaxID=2320817 RepID=UPI002618C6FB|nr:hypothetical protein [uncultured Mycolicibacterium sp.]